MKDLRENSSELEDTPPYFTKSRCLSNDIKNLKWLNREQYPNYEEDYKTQLELPKSVTKRAEKKKEVSPTRIQPPRKMKQKSSSPQPNPQPSKKSAPRLPKPIKEKPKNFQSKKRKTAASPQLTTKVDEPNPVEINDEVKLSCSNKKTRFDDPSLNDNHVSKQELINEIDNINYKYQMKRQQCSEEYCYDISQLLKRSLQS